MAGTATAAPRGSRAVSKAFIAALNALPEAQRAEAGKAAIAQVREHVTALKKAPAPRAKRVAAAPAEAKRPARKAATPTEAAPTKRARRAKGAQLARAA